MATKKKVVEQPESVDRKSWKYYCNDEQVSEAVFKQVQQDHAQWVLEQEKLAAQKQADEAKLDKKGTKNVIKARKR